MNFISYLNHTLSHPYSLDIQANGKDRVWSEEAIERNRKSRFENTLKRYMDALSYLGGFGISSRIGQQLGFNTTSIVKAVRSIAERTDKIYEVGRVKHQMNGHAAVVWGIKDCVPPEILELFENGRIPSYAAYKKRETDIRASLQARVQCKL